MPRARTIKPGFFSNDELVELSFSTRLLFIGLWTIADKEGRLMDRPKKIKMEIFPADDVDCDAAIGDLSKRGFVTRYEVAGVKCLQINKWKKHQNPHVKEIDSVIPEIPEQTPEIPERAALIPSSLIPHSLSPIPVSDRASAKPATVSEPDGFADFRKLYPKRQGSQRWQDAISAYRARLREGVTPEEILLGAERYALFVRADGKEGTEFVMQAATFIGKNRGYTEPWKPPQKVVALGPVERVLAAAKKANGDERVVSEQGNGSVGNPVRDLRQPLLAGVRGNPPNAVDVSDWEHEGLRDYERSAASE